MEHTLRFGRGCISHVPEEITVCTKVVILYSKGSKTVTTGRTANGFGETVDVDHGHAGVVCGKASSHCKKERTEKNTFEE